MICAYVSPMGRSDVEAVYRCNVVRQAGLDVALEYLRVLPRARWSRPASGRIRGPGDFYEIRFVAELNQQRPIGFFGPEVNDFTILIWAIEKSRSFSPPNWQDSAMRRKKQILNGSATAKPLSIRDENSHVK
jgi:hypothetical protein